MEEMKIFKKYGMRENLFKEYVVNISLTAATLILFMATLEVIFRVFDIRGYYLPRTREWNHALLEPAKRVKGIHIQFKPHSQFFFAYDSNPRGYFDDNNGLTYELNNYGFRGPDYRLEKIPEKKRIIILGDSFTFGEGVRLEDTFGVRLENLLHQKGFSVEVLNFGISTWGTSDEVNYLAEMGIKFHPDLVLIVFVLNDANYAGGMDVWDNFRAVYEKRRLRHSYLLSYIYAKIAQPFYVKNYVENLTQQSLADNTQWNEAFAQLLRGKKIAQKEQFQYGVAIFPFMYDLKSSYPFLKIHDMIVSYCQKHDIDVYDLFPAFQGNRYTTLWVHPSDPHPNEKGHQIAAKALANFITTHHLLKPF